MVRSIGSDDLQLEVIDRGKEASNAKRLRALEDENGNLSRLPADAMLDKAALKDLLSAPRCEARSRRLPPVLPRAARAAGAMTNKTKTQRLYKRGSLKVRRRRNRRR